MPKKTLKPTPPATPEKEACTFEEVLKANDEIAEEGKALKPDQTHRYEAGKPVRQRFTIG